MIQRMYKAKQVIQVQVLPSASFLYGVQFLSVNKQRSKMGERGMHATVIMAES